VFDIVITGSLNRLPVRCILRRTASRLLRVLSLAPYASLAFTLLACGPSPLASADASGNGVSGGGGHDGLAGSGTSGVGLNSAGASGYGGAAGLNNAGPDAASDGGPTPYHSLAVVTGQLHTCALLDDHNVKCWGDNGYGQLGYGDMLQRGGTPTDMGNALPIVDLGTGHKATTIAAGAYNTCAVLEDSTLKCWGWSQLNGQPSKGDIGDQPGEMGDDLVPLNFGGHKVVNVGIGSLAACASLDDNTIWCWTNSTANIPQIVAGLPSKAVKAISAVANEVVALYEDGTVSHVLPDGPVIDPSAGSNHRVLAISGTQGKTCEVLDNGTIACLEMPARTTTVLPSVAATTVGVEYLNVACALFADGSIRCPPDNPGGQTCNSEAAYWCNLNGTIALVQGATALTNGGQGFTCALLTDGGIRCWNFGGEIPASLGAAVSLSGTSASMEYGPWNEVDLGSHP